MRSLLFAVRHSIASHSDMACHRLSHSRTVESPDTLIASPQLLRIPRRSKPRPLLPSGRPLYGRM